MKNKIIISIIIALFLNNVDVAYANIINTSYENGKQIYYVDSEESNLLCINSIRSNMEVKAEIIYSGELAPLDKTTKHLRKYYYNMIYASNHSYQDNIFIRSYSAASNVSCVIKSIKYNKDNSITVNYNFYYLDTLDQSNYVINQINDAVKNNISDLKTEYEKVCWAYKWVSDNVNYDFTLVNSSAYSGITDKGTVCRGYALLFNIVAEKLGLNCRYVEGSINQSIDNNHAWNIIEINEKWYCVDTTWGDNVNYNKYFLKSKDTFALAEYQYHSSKIYDSYINAGEIFADTDYIDDGISKLYGVLPSVYNIKMDILKRNTITVNETYNFMISNPDNVIINFVSNNPDIATVNENGVITGINNGTTVITAYNTALNIEQSCEITIE